MKRQLFGLYQMLPIRLRRLLKRALRRLPPNLFDRGLVYIAGAGGVPGLFKTWSVAYDALRLSQARTLAGERIRDADGELFVAGLQDVQLDLATGIIHVAGGKLLAESSVDSRQRRAEVLRGNVGRATGRTLCGATYATIVTLFDRNYFHWLIDTLPRLYLLKALGSAEPVTLLMPADIRPYELTTLRWCVPPNMSIEFVDSCEPIVVERLLMPSNIRERLNGYVPIEHLDYVRSAIQKNTDKAMVREPARRVYVSRALAGRRRVLNEGAVVECLADHDFEVVQAEKLSVEEQAILFRDVEWIVGPHGAGLTNMLFAKRTRVLEFLGDPEPTERHFGRLAASLGHEHEYLRVEQESKDSNITVDIGELERWLVDWSACRAAARGRGG